MLQQKQTPKPAGKDKPSPRKTVAIVVSLIFGIVVFFLLRTTTGKAQVLLLYYMNEDIREIAALAAPSVPAATVETIRGKWQRMRAAVERGDADLARVSEARRMLARARRDGRIDDAEAAALESLVARW